MQKTYSKSAVKRAGEVLIKDQTASVTPEQQLEALKVLSYWRACHLVPLEAAVREVEEVSQQKHRSAFIAKRLKRAPSIIAKLRRNKSMDLQNMQDVGGCRVILSSIRQVNQLRRALTARRDYHRIKDYIKRPKEDGYRGIHVIGKFPDKSGSMYQIEIQLRTQIQHAWATALEIVDLFTKQHLKAGEGNLDWARFFRLVGEAMSHLDGVPANEERHRDVCVDVVRLTRDLDVLRRFEGFSRSLAVLEDEGVKGIEGYYLLEVDTHRTTVQYHFYDIEGHDAGVEHYLELEKTSLKSPEKVVAFVSTDALGGLKEAYPNYFADSAKFVWHLETILARGQLSSLNWFTKFFIDLGRSLK